MPELHEMEKGESLFGHVELFLTDALYNLPRKGGKMSSKHDVFPREDIRDLVDLCSEVMVLGSHGLISCA